MGAGAEGGTLDDCHESFIEEGGGEVRVRCDALAGGRDFADEASDAGEDVEGAFGLMAGDAGDVVEGGNDKVPPALVGGGAFGEEILRASECRGGGGLADGGDAGGGGALDDGAGGNEGGGAGAEADAPAGHGVSFGDAGHGDDAAGQVRCDGGQCGVGEVVEKQVFVNVVRQDPDVGVAAEDFGDGGKLGGADGGAGRVIGVVEDEQARAGGDGGFQGFGLEDEAFGLGAGEKNRDAAGELDGLLVAGPSGGGDDDVVTIIDDGHDDVENSLLAAVGNKNVFRPEGEFLVAGVFFDDGGFKGFGAGERRVFGLTILRRLVCGVDDMGRGGEIRLTDR